MDVSPKDVQLNVEDDIEYKDGNLYNSSGHMTLTLARAKSTDKADKMFSNVLETKGSYSMKKKKLKCEVYSQSEYDIMIKLEGAKRVDTTLLANIDISELIWFLQRLIAINRKNGVGHIGSSAQNPEDKKCNNKTSR